MRKLDNKTIIELRKMMKNGNSQYDVAKTLNIGKTSIQRYAKDIIKVNDIKDKEEKIIIRRLYNDGFNSVQLAKEFNRTPSGIRLICKDIMRTQAQSIIGKNNPAWRGGVTNLQHRIRNSSKYKKWREYIFQRDNWTCQFTNQVGGKLIADHIKPFALILEENNIKTFQEAMNCDSLWNYNNGRTITKKSHENTDTYGWKTYNILRKKPTNTKI